MERRLELSSGHEIWTKTVGDGSGIPLLLLHGGPGAGHDYLEPLEALGSDRPVIFYDQLGCGKSGKPENRAFWTIERFADEVQEVRDTLGIERCHILGQSWGGWLGIEYMLRQPVGLQSFVLASTSSSIPQFSAECDRLISELPEENRKALEYHGARGEFEHEAYAAAEEMFYRRHLCRLEEWPNCMLRSIENLHHNTVYESINGPNEFTTIGNLRYWNRTPDLDRIKIPVLITCGRYDELGPACAATLQAHVAHVEEPEAYRKSVSEFLTRHDD